jgi:hypothetical protein
MFSVQNPARLPLTARTSSFKVPVQSSLQSQVLGETLRFAGKDSGKAETPKSAVAKLVGGIAIAIGAIATGVVSISGPVIQTTIESTHRHVKVDVGNATVMYGRTDQGALPDDMATKMPVLYTSDWGVTQDGNSTDMHPVFGVREESGRYEVMSDLDSAVTIVTVIPQGKNQFKLDAEFQPEGEQSKSHLTVAKAKVQGSKLTITSALDGRILIQADIPDDYSAKDAVTAAAAFLPEAFSGKQVQQLSDKQLAKIEQVLDKQGINRKTLGAWAQYAASHSAEGIQQNLKKK